MATKRIIDLTQAGTEEITADQAIAIDKTNTLKATLQQIANWIVAQVPASSGGSPITAVMQNVINEKAGLPSMAIKNAGWDSYYDNKNITYTLASNYSAGATSIELTCTSPISTFKPIYPCRIIIYDGTNRSYATLTAFTSGTNYTLASALVNDTGSQVSYSTSTAVIKRKMKTRSGGLASIPAGITGQALATPEDILVKYLEEGVTDATLNIFRGFIAEEFTVSTLPSTTTTKITSATDKSTVFPSGTNFVMYHKKDNGCTVESKENATWLKNFSVFTTSASSTYAGTDITLTHSAKVNTGAVANGEYYVMKLPTLKALVEDAGTAGTPLAVAVKEFLIYSSVLARHKTTDFTLSLWQEASSSVNHWAITNNIASIYSSNDYCSLWLTSWPIRGGDFDFKYDWKTQYNGGSGPDNSYTRIGSSESYGASTNIMSAGNGISVMNTYDSTAYVYYGGVQQGSIPAMTGADIYSTTRIKKIGKTVFVKRWLTSIAEPEAYNLTFTISESLMPGNTIYFMAHSTGAIYTKTIQNVTLSPQSGPVVVYELTEQAGNKVTIATPTEINSATLEFPVDTGVGFIIQ